MLTFWLEIRHHVTATKLAHLNHSCFALALDENALNDSLGLWETSWQKS
ncbi:MAG: hypothetical protein QOH70_2034 [Blastocatellia bacterium]|jgi:hypothetical protein|nr:hypothetical protein [Blastocatellia bacterium]